MIALFAISAKTGAAKPKAMPEPRHIASIGTGIIQRPFRAAG